MTKQPLCVSAFSFLIVLLLHGGPFPFPHFSNASNIIHTVSDNLLVLDHEAYHASKFLPKEEKTPEAAGLSVYCRNAGARRLRNCADKHGPGLYRVVSKKDFESFGGVRGWSSNVPKYLTEVEFNAAEDPKSRIAHLRSGNNITYVSKYVHSLLNGVSYCNAHRYAFWVYLLGNDPTKPEVVLLEGRTGHFSKLLGVQATLSLSIYEWVVLSDQDAWFHTGGLQERGRPPKYLEWEDTAPLRGYLERENTKDIVVQDMQAICVGVLAFRNSKFTQDFMRRWWAEGIKDYTKLRPDQVCFSHLMFSDMAGENGLNYPGGTRHHCGWGNPHCTHFLKQDHFSAPWADFDWTHFTFISEKGEPFLEKYYEEGTGRGARRLRKGKCKARSEGKCEAGNRGEPVEERLVNYALHFCSFAPSECSMVNPGVIMHTGDGSYPTYPTFSISPFHLVDNTETGGSAAIKKSVSEEFGEEHLEAA
uniref:Nucleotide-diphospho-sugar transferase domain-containing protein n=1 Tax=Chromera velia CCMP2878 TaxID=1169474 RepID=A0A0G4I9Y7_9ALVE|eukprot:Cvel_12395.t1-p1 / transcript=Cvel_12395.t1 / gene=Cvel_12395 / organism=Chromera_velia_CCMP2878 / gene_product=hypothetical protein / transcript_product=hypothetical protein / location=Cvel_scaffold809:58302-60257(+) / protein_length=474 / sequence_SO=supercontig / SO=protein_coding / is_pseudo=false